MQLAVLDYLHVASIVRKISVLIGAILFLARRGVGTGGGRGARPPQVLSSALFPGAKCPFSCVKNVMKIAFFAQRALLKT
jgi:hypothetical protein